MKLSLFFVIALILFVSSVLAVEEDETRGLKKAGGPPGLAKKGGTPPGLAKKKGGKPPGQTKPKKVSKKSKKGEKPGKNKTQACRKK